MFDWECRVGKVRDDGAGDKLMSKRCFGLDWLGLC